MIEYVPAARFVYLISVTGFVPVTAFIPSILLPDASTNARSDVLELPVLVAVTTTSAVPVTVNVSAPSSLSSAPFASSAENVSLFPLVTVPDNVKYPSVPYLPDAIAVFFSAVVIAVSADASNVYTLLAAETALAANPVGINPTTIKAAITNAIILRFVFLFITNLLKYYGTSVVSGEVNSTELYV